MEQDINKATQTDMTTVVTDYEVPSEALDSPTGAKETEWINPRWSIQLGLFKTIPEFYRAVTALSTWTAGKGYTTDDVTQTQLNNIKTCLFSSHRVRRSNGTVPLFYLKQIFCILSGKP